MGSPSKTKINKAKNTILTVIANKGAFLGSEFWSESPLVVRAKNLISQANYLHPTARKPKDFSFDNKSF